MQTKLLINGTLTAGQGPAERVLDPATGECIAEVPGGERLAGRCRRRRRRGGRCRLGEDGAQGSRRAAAAPGRSHRSARRGLRQARVGQHRQAARCGVERRDSGHRRRVSLLRGRRAHRARSHRRRISARLHQHDSARSGRRRRLDRALELSLDDGRLEARTGARRGQHGRAQALGADTAHAR